MRLNDRHQPNPENSSELLDDFLSEKATKMPVARPDPSPTSPTSSNSLDGFIPAHALDTPEQDGNASFTATGPQQGSKISAPIRDASDDKLDDAPAQLRHRMVSQHSTPPTAKAETPSVSSTSHEQTPKDARPPVVASRTKQFGMNKSLGSSATRLVKGQPPFSQSVSGSGEVQIGGMLYNVNCHPVRPRPLIPLTITFWALFTLSYTGLFTFWQSGVNGLAWSTIVMMVLVVAGARRVLGRRFIPSRFWTPWVLSAITVMVLAIKGSSLQFTNYVYGGVMIGVCVIAHYVVWQSALYKSRKRARTAALFAEAKGLALYYVQNTQPQGSKTMCSIWDFASEKPGNMTVWGQTFPSTFTVVDSARNIHLVKPR